MPNFKIKFSLSTFRENRAAKKELKATLAASTEPECIHGEEGEKEPKLKRGMRPGPSMAEVEQTIRDLEAQRKNDGSPEDFMIDAAKIDVATEAADRLAFNDGVRRDHRVRNRRIVSVGIAIPSVLGLTGVGANMGVADARAGNLTERPVFDVLSRELLNKEVSIDRVDIPQDSIKDVINQNTEEVIDKLNTEISNLKNRGLPPALVTRFTNILNSGVGQIQDVVNEKIANASQDLLTEGKIDINKVRDFVKEQDHKLLDRAVNYTGTQLMWDISQPVADFRVKHDEAIDRAAVNVQDKFADVSTQGFNGAQEVVDEFFNELDLAGPTQEGVDGINQWLKDNVFDGISTEQREQVTSYLNQFVDQYGPTLEKDINEKWIPKFEELLNKFIQDEISNPINGGILGGGAGGLSGAAIAALLAAALKFFFRKGDKLQDIDGMMDILKRALGLEPPDQDPEVESPIAAPIEAPAAPEQIAPIATAPDPELEEGINVAQSVVQARMDEAQTATLAEDVVPEIPALVPVATAAMTKGVEEAVETIDEPVKKAPAKKKPAKKPAAKPRAKTAASTRAPKAKTAAKKTPAKPRVTAAQRADLTAQAARAIEEAATQTQNETPKSEPKTSKERVTAFFEKAAEKTNGVIHRFLNRLDVRLQNEKKPWANAAHTAVDFIEKKAPGAINAVFNVVEKGIEKFLDSRVTQTATDPN